MDINVLDNAKLNAPIFNGILLGAVSKEVPVTTSPTATQGFSQGFKQKRSTSVASRTSIIGGFYFLTYINYEFSIKFTKKNYFKSLVIFV